MKLLYIPFFFLFSSFAGIGSDNLLCEEVRNFLHKSLQEFSVPDFLSSSSPPTISSDHRIKMESLKVQEDDLNSIHRFIKVCSEEALQRPRLGFLPPESHRFCSSAELGLYLKTSLCPVEWHSLIYYVYYVGIGEFALKQRDFPIAVRNFCLGASYQPQRIRQHLNAFIRKNFFKNQKKEASAIPYKKLIHLYEKVRIDSGCREWDAIDCITFFRFYFADLNWERAAYFGQLALQKKWPETHHPDYCFVIDRDQLILNLGYCFYGTNQPEEAINYWLPKESLLHTQHLFLMSVYYATKNKWDQSWEYLRKTYQKDGDLLIKETDALSLLPMLLRIKEIKKNDLESIRLFFKTLTNLFPQIIPVIEKMKKDIKKEKLQQWRSKIKKGIAADRYLKIKDLLQNAKDLSQVLLLKSKFFSDTPKAYLCGTLEKKTEKFLLFNSNFLELSDIDQIERNIKEITQRYNFLKNYFQELKTIEQDMSYQYNTLPLIPLSQPSLPVFQQHTQPSFIQYTLKRGPFPFPSKKLSNPTKSQPSSFSRSKKLLSLIFPL